MFRSPNEIPPLIDLLATRQASLWHACQLADLRSYLRLGGIPSRQRLERERLAFTRFQSDTSDRARGVWDKVFLNLGDLGRPFAWGMRSTPNVYGPIALQLAPQALAECSDVAVCLRSASSIGFDRDAEAFSTLTQMNEVFAHPVAAGFPRSSFTRYGDSLREAFPSPAEARTPEVSCTVQRTASPGPGVLSFEHLVVIWVDPISVGDASLLDAVRRAVEEVGIKVPVHARSMSGERRQVLGDLAMILCDRPLPLQLLGGHAHASPAMRAWALGLLGRDLQWVWDRYAQYLIEGTLQPLAPDRSLSARIAAPQPGPRPSSRPTHIAELLDRFKEH